MVSLAFAPIRVISSCFQQVYKTIGRPVEHHVLTNHYPIDHDVNEKVVKALCEAYKITWHDLGQNVGLSAGYNHLINNLNLQDDDVVIGVDPDTWPETPGWSNALVSVLQDKTIAWASLMNHHAVNELPQRGYTTHTVNGVIAYEAHQACVNSICAWPGWFLKRLNGLKEPNQWYGGIEIMSMPKIKQMGFKWVYLPEFKEAYHSRVEGDGPYRHYKWEYAHKHSTKLDFKAWLEQDPSRLELK
jgi:hypothetical protein